MNKFLLLLLLPVFLFIIGINVNAPAMEYNGLTTFEKVDKMCETVFTDKDDIDYCFERTMDYFVFYGRFTDYEGTEIVLKMKKNMIDLRDNPPPPLTYHQVTRYEANELCYKGFDHLSTYEFGKCMYDYGQLRTIEATLLDPSTLDERTLFDIRTGWYDGDYSTAKERFHRINCENGIFHAEYTEKYC